MNVSEFMSWFNRTHTLLGTFQPRDYQMYIIMKDYFEKRGIDEDEVRGYAEVLPWMLQLQQIGYFHPAPSPEHSRIIREFEQRLPRTVRRDFRKFRFSFMYTGPLGGG